MSRPEDIPQDVWDTAFKAMPVGHREVYERSPFSMALHLGFARAIMAEREANEAVCVERAARHKASVAQYPDDEASRVLCLDSALEAMECAAAIRKRGES